MSSHQRKTISSERSYDKVNIGTTNLSWYSPVPIFAISSGIISVILVSLWAQDKNDFSQSGYLGKPNWYAGGNGLFSWHPILMVGGFHFAQVLAISVWSVIPSHYVAKILHFLFHLCALVTCITSLVAVFKVAYESKSPNLTTIHSWLGILTTCSYVLNFLWGMIMALLTKFNPDSTIRKNIDLSMIHICIGLTAFGLTLVTIISGIMDQLVEGSCFYTNQSVNNPIRNYPNLPDACKIANGLGIVVTITTILVFITVLIRHTNLTTGRSYEVNQNINEPQNKHNVFLGTAIFKFV